MQPQGMTVIRVKGLRFARGLCLSGVPRINGVREMPKATGRLGFTPPGSRAQASREAGALRRECARLREKLGVTRLIEAQVEARIRRANRRLALARDKSERS